MAAGILSAPGLTLEIGSREALCLHSKLFDAHPFLDLLVLQVEPQDT
jgi:hypothetical protein